MEIFLTPTPLWEMPPSSQNGPHTPPPTHHYPPLTSAPSAASDLIAATVRIIGHKLQLLQHWRNTAN